MNAFLLWTLLAAGSHTIFAASSGDLVLDLQEFNSLGGQELRNTSAQLRLAGSLTLGTEAETSQSGTLNLIGGIGAGGSRTAATDLASAHAFPVPFRPAQGHTKITFTGLTAQSTVKIYTVSGELVKTMGKSDGLTDSLPWNARNEKGENLASGIYFFLIQDVSGGIRRGQLLIIR